MLARLRSFQGLSGFTIGSIFDVAPLLVCDVEILEAHGNVWWMCRCVWKRSTSCSSGA